VARTPRELFATARQPGSARLLAFFPVDAAVPRVSPLEVRQSAATRYVVAAVHFLIFRQHLPFLYSAVTDAQCAIPLDASFAGILVRAVLTVDTTFLILFFHFLPVSLSTFIGNGIAPGSRGAVSPAVLSATERNRKFNRALVFPLSTCDRIDRSARACFLFPGFSAGTLGRA